MSLLWEQKFIFHYVSRLKMYWIWFSVISQHQSSGTSITPTPPLQITPHFFQKMISVVEEAGTSLTYFSLWNQHSTPLFYPFFPQNLSSIKLKNQVSLSRELVLRQNAVGMLLRECGNAFTSWSTYEISLIAWRNIIGGWCHQLGNYKAYLNQAVLANTLSETLSVFVCLSIFRENCFSPLFRWLYCGERTTIQEVCLTLILPTIQTSWG